MTMAIILNKSAGVTGEGLKNLPVCGVLSGRQAGRNHLGPMLLRGFQVTKAFSCLMGMWQLPPASKRGLMHMATKSPLHRQLPASQPAQPGDISGWHLPPGSSFGRTFFVGNAHCNAQLALSAAGKLDLGSPPCKAWGVGIACPHLPLNLNQF